MHPTESKLWTDGWYRFAKHVHSPNFGARPANCKAQLIVIHSISLPPHQFGSDHIERFFCNQLNHSEHPYFQGLVGVQVSAHFLIKRNSDLIQFVSCKDRAWHAGESTFQGKENCNDFSIGIELEGAEWAGTFEPGQYETLSALCSSLIGEYPVMHFAGHEHISPGRKKDPGSGFYWSYLQRSLGLSDSFFHQTRG